LLFATFIIAITRLICASLPKCICLTYGRGATGRLCRSCRSEIRRAIVTGCLSASCALSKERPSSEPQGPNHAQDYDFS
jgi:hypothetical protein